MKYHSSTFGLILQPVASGSEDRLSLAEQRLGIVLPNSVREWYSVVDGQDILSKYSNVDTALTPSEFRLIEICGRQLVQFLIENQGVCWWGFELNGSDDPPVFVDFDPPPDKLFLYAKTFSEFTYLRVFDFDGWWDADRFTLETRAPLAEPARRWLVENYKSEPYSFGWPGIVTLRYSSLLGRIIIWESDGQADWILLCTSAVALQELKGQVCAVW